MKAPKIAIIGTPILGSTCSILLARAGFNVQIFEQRKVNIVKDRGVGKKQPKMPKIGILFPKIRIK